jgi:polyhydroxybutyrate depolymerase
MSYRLACELSDRIAAIAPVAGVLGVSDCDPPRAVPVLHFHGTLDGLVPLDGGGVGNFPSVDETVNHWSDHDGCAGDPEVSFEEGDARCDRWQGCDDGSAVEVCIIDGGGHTWPGGQVPAAAGKTSRDISASDRMWEFFRDHPMPGQ